jgi:gliding motility-associated-like protein
MKKYTILFFFTILVSYGWGQCKITADFTYFYTDCSTIQFTDASTVSSDNYNLVIWHWDYGDSTTATGQTVTHTFTPGATVQVQLIVTADSSGVTCTDTVVKTITVHALPTVYIQSDPNPSCVTVPARFFGTSGQKIQSWQWDFGDGKSDTLQNVSHLYPDTGTYRVALHVIDTNHCANTDSSFFQKVNPAPTLDFSWNINPAAVTDNLQFTATGEGNVTAWHWDFGDGDTANIQNPTHQFADTGQYHVTLSIIVDGLCTNALTKTVHIEPLPAPDFSVSPACMNDTTFFTDLSTTPVGTITTRKWYFGDGDSLILNDTSNTPVTHIYRLSTTYQVTLQVMNSEGYQRSVSQPVTVHLKPEGAFTFSDTCFNKPIGFLDRSSQNGGSAIQTWNWNFGDPASGIHDTSSLQNPQHTMSVPDTFSVRLIVTNKDGCRDTVVHTVVVDSLPAVDFTVSQDSVCLGEKIRFNGTGKNIALWDWDFGNGDSSTFQTPVYRFPQPGLYTVTLKVTNLKGCTNSISHDVYIIGLPKPDFSSSHSCIGDTTYFTDKSSDSTGYVAQWNWNFGDSTSADNLSAQQNPAHHFKNVSSYRVQLIAVNNFGCRDTVSKFVNVYDRPKPRFTYLQACSPASEVQFHDTSAVGSNKAPIRSYLWNFYEDDTSHQQNPVYKFLHIDTCYLVSLRVTDTNGCANADTVKVCVRDSLRIDFSAQEACFTQSSHFTASYLPATDSILRYTWNFGDGSRQAATFHDTISHIYPHPGKYIVQLSAIDTNGCRTTVTHQAVVDSLPVPDFSFVTPACDRPTFFTDRSQGGGNFISNWQWHFGDPTSGIQDTSTAQNPSHFYGPMAGKYPVKLIVTNFNGCIDSITKPVVRPSCLVTLFSMVPGKSCARNTVFFKDHSKVHSLNGNIIQWRWDFGDGSEETHDTLADSVPHIYQQGKSYRVRLTVTAKVNGITFSVPYDSVIVIHPTPTPAFVAGNLCLGGETTFTDQSTGNGAPVNAWLWHFNDPDSKVDTSALQNPIHVFSSATKYPIQLIVSNKYGCEDSTTQSIQINRSPKADFSVGKACSRQEIQFADSSQTFGTQLTGWQWAFNDPYSTQDSAFTANTTHVYDSAGKFLVQLVVTDNHFCSDTIAKPVEVHPTPIANFDILYNYRGITGQALMENKTEGASTYFWDFGDGNTSTAVNPVNKYESGGIYNIVMVATSPFQCSDTITKVYDLTLGLYIPNSFAPDNDVPGTNRFQPIGIHLKEYHIQVYSSWGTLLWESTKLTENGEPAEGWDGTFEGQPMPAGNYIWRVEAKFIDNSIWHGSNNGDGNVKPYGIVTLIR